MKIILNAGHTLSGAGSGAVGYINESEEARKIVNAVKRYLTGKGHNVVVVNVDKASSQSAYLKQVVEKANEHSDADLFLSAHFNAGGGRGTECYTWRGQRLPSAVGICAELNKYGFRNRGVKDGSGLYVISKTTMPAILVEVCFVDDELDAKLYKALGVNMVAQAITRGILK
ncbi:MAG: N-acetylmuramoyl-L-alanine amidase [Candidatus Coproplasma sp.]